MKYNGYKLVSEISKSNLIISGLSAGKGAVSGNLIGRKIGIRKHNKDLQTARLNVIRIKSELERDPSKIKEVELATERLRSLESPESRKKYIKKYQCIFYSIRGYVKAVILTALLYRTVLEGEGGL